MYQIQGKMSSKFILTCPQGFQAVSKLLFSILLWERRQMAAKHSQNILDQLVSTEVLSNSSSHQSQWNTARGLDFVQLFQRFYIQQKPNKEKSISKLE